MEVLIVLGVLVILGAAGYGISVLYTGAANKPPPVVTRGRVKRDARGKAIQGRRR